MGFIGYSIFSCVLGVCKEGVNFVDNRRFCIEGGDVELVRGVLWLWGFVCLLFNLGCIWSGGYSM